jgi:propionate CoA-transferase
MKIVAAEEAIAEIRDDWTLVPGGFGSCGHPDTLTAALRARYLATGRPRALTYLFAAGAGDKCGSGLDSIALEGLVRRAIGGFWGLSPRLAGLATGGRIEAHNWPQGIISKLFSAIAGDAPGVISRIGIGTFVDPREDGGVIDSAGSAPLVRDIRIGTERWLLYPVLRIDCALLRGSSADGKGNISFEDETSYMDALAQAMAARRCGGLVIVQVKRLVDQIAPQDVRIPGILVDRVVVAREEQHPQTYGCRFDPAYTRGGISTSLPARDTDLAKAVVAHRAALELGKHPGATVNLGIGIPALIGPAASKAGVSDFTLTIESGLIGGVPEEGLSFGASRHPQAFIEQSAIFDIYHGGGLGVAFLGFAQANARGDVNVSRFAGSVPGSGGFIDISQSATKVVFCGTFTTGGLSVVLDERRLRIAREGREQKLVTSLTHRTFNAEQALRNGQQVMFITERAVFRLAHDAMVLEEIAPGITVDALRDACAIDFTVGDALRPMPGPWDARIPEPSLT